ncbi:amino acid decarboxylase [Enterococcus sp. BWM-S5]|uniref:Amino acid decarboxylase n=1 Tax=Enterococcus larvae TaxID=2794352 RepID=A0ABS4CGN0_9ENTE|nr:amino acid decarboxylase [Enterococcus larvae]MBP1045009.1 amino acid decarboxylase [Enterococcus larvae]
MSIKEQSFSVEMVGYEMKAELKRIGSDILILLTGGDTPHIGTVTVFSENDPASSFRFPSHSGRKHKDDVLAEIVLKIIQPALRGNCVITSGIHVDHITQEQIQAASKMASHLGTAILHWLQEHPAEAKEPIYYNANESPLEK